MDRFLALLPANLYSLFNDFRYKIIVYPIMITYYLNKEQKYDESEVNKKIKKLSKSFSEFISKTEENDKLQTTILDYFKESIGPELKNIHIGISCNRLFKSKFPYYRNFTTIKEKGSSDLTSRDNRQSMNMAQTPRLPRVKSYSKFGVTKESVKKCIGMPIESNYSREARLASPVNDEETQALERKRSETYSIKYCPCRMISENEVYSSDEESLVSVD